MTPTDLTAAGAIRAAAARGYRVPQDISVVGFDDIYEARQMLPPLTTVSQNIASTAAMICRRLIALRDGEDSPERRITIGTSLVVRESTGKAKA
jgi:DNA-binding LacI/PurR family transcriptional regulator